MLLILALLLACAGLLWLSFVLRALPVRVLCGALVLPLAMLSGMAVVNDYFGYYRSWDAITTDLTGSYAPFAAAASARTDHRSLHGRMVSVQLPGARSGISRTGLVYLPPQYDRPRYAHTRFPVDELVHGTPGSPSQWVVQLRIADLVDQLISHHQLGPMVLVMPTAYSGTQFEEGLDTASALDDTYLTRDVPTDVMRHFRVSRVRAMWGIAGFSSGGYIAANLALRHRGAYGAAGIMDGYFRPRDGEAASVLGDPAAQAANDPLRAVSQLRPGVGPLPAFWVSAGTGDAADLHGAEVFVATLRHIEQVPFEIEEHAHHTFYAWESSLPHLLTWTWQELASPALRSAFPSTGVSPNYTVHLSRRAQHRDWLLSGQHRHGHRNRSDETRAIAGSRPVRG